jgi:hypothetical protein
MIQLTPDLSQLGDALERAAAADLHAARRPRRRALLRPRVLVAAGMAVALLGGGGAFAAEKLLGGKEVADSLIAGTFALQGRQATCSLVREGIEYRCTLDRPPAPEVADWKGTVEPSVDATKHVNGGCRSLSSGGLEWECYLGQAAVDQQIVSQDFLGEYAPNPGRG